MWSIAAILKVITSNLLNAAVGEAQEERKKNSFIAKLIEEIYKNEK